MSDKENKPKRLYFKSYLQLIHNSLGSNLFRNLYIQTANGESDALDDGRNACAFYVSAVLVIFKKLDGIHGTVASTVRDLQQSGWQLVDKPEAGDVLVWEARDVGDGPQQHIGFAIGDNKAISISWTQKVPVEHDQTFDGQRQISQVFRSPDWDENPA